jgi:hypothetical protein
MVKGRKILAALIGLAVVMTMTDTGWAVGNVKQEMWLQMSTTTLDDAILIAQGGTESTVTTLPSLEYAGSMIAGRPSLDTYVERLTAWVVAPVTGNYTFYIAGDDDCGLWIGETPIVDVATTPPLCRVTGWTGYRDFTGNPERQSAPVALVAGTAYKLVVIHREGTSGDYVSVAWTLPGGTTIDVIGGAFITDQTKAGGAVPADTQTDVKSGVLTWLPPAKSSGSANLTYDVYFGTDANLPAPYLKASGLAARTYNAGAVNGSDLLFSKTYYWRINVSDPNIGGTPVYRVGDVWSLTTNDGKPFIVTAPTNVFGALNGNASFTVAAATLAPTPLFYQWQFKTFFGTTWTNLNGATGPTYSKTGLQPSDRGLYRVTVTDLYNNSLTSEARLYMRIGLVNRYSFTDNANDSISGAHGTIYQTTGYPATFIDAPGTTGDPTKRQLYLTNGPTRTSNGTLMAYVDLPNGVVSTLGTQATFMVWFTWRDTDMGQSWQRVFDLGNSVQGENLAGTGNNYMMLTPRSDGRTPRFGYKIRDGGEERFLNASASLTTTSGQVCYAITWNEDTGRAEMYRNGKLVAAGDTHFTLRSINDFNNWLGRAQWNDNGFWGNLDEFRIYDVALPGNSIALSYALGADVLPGNPCVNQPTADINQDCVIDLADFALLAEQWLDCGLTTCP